MMGVAPSTYYLWLKAHPEFSEALKRGQTDKRARLRNTMFQSAIGFHVAEEKIFLHEGKPVRVETMRYIAPNSTMQVFLACNEMPEEYKHVQHIQAGGGIDVHLKDTVPAQFIMDMNKFMTSIGEKAPKNGNGHHPAPAPKRELAKAGSRYAPRTSMDIQGDGDEDIPMERRNKAEPEYEPEDTGDLDLSELEDD